MTEMAVMLEEEKMDLGAEAALLIQSVQNYMDCEVVWDFESNAHMVVFMHQRGIKINADNLGEYLSGHRTALLGIIQEHLEREFSQDGISGVHGKKGTYVHGCRGLLCRRAQRNAQRLLRDPMPRDQDRFAMLDTLIVDACKRIDASEPKWTLEE